MHIYVCICMYTEMHPTVLILCFWRTLMQMRQEEQAGRREIEKEIKTNVVYTWMRKCRFFFSKEALSNIFLVLHIDRWPSLPLINLIWGNNRKVVLLAYNCKDIPWGGRGRRRWQTLAYSYQVGKDWRQEEKGATEDEMVGWHHWPSMSWVWVNSRSWWWTGRPAEQQSMGLQRVVHNWATELNQAVSLKCPILVHHDKLCTLLSTFFFSSCSEITLDLQEVAKIVVFHASFCFGNFL